MVQDGLAAEFVAFLTLIAISFPYLMSLDHTFRLRRPSGVPALQWRMWTWVFLLQSIYFNFHPMPLHPHGHHHAVSDMVKFPVVLQYGLPVVTLLVFTCRIYDKYLESMPKGATFKVKLLTLAGWCLIPAVLGGLLTLGAWLLLRSNFRRSLILYFLGGVAAIGAFVFSLGSFLQITRSEKSVQGASIILHHLPFMIQMLGFLGICLVLVLNYVNVDWPAVIQFGIMFTGNLAFVLSRGCAKKRGYNPVTVQNEGSEEFEV